MRRRWIWGTAALGAIPLAAGLVASRRASHRRRIRATPAEAGLDYSEVRLTSEDDTPLSAWWVPRAGSREAVVIVTGWSGNRSEPKVIQTAKTYHQAGLSALLLDVRSQGGSGGVRVTAGALELRDVRAALSLLRERGFPPERVVLHGFSMGAASVVMAAPGTGVGAVVEDSGYADLELLIAHLLRRFGLPVPFARHVLWAAGLLARVDAPSIRPVEQARVLYEEGVPLLAVHSKADRLVPFEHAELFTGAHPEAHFIRTHLPGHATAHDLPEYGSGFLGFLKKAGF